MLDRVEELIQQPDCPNLYWPLMTLPAPFVNVRPALEFEHHMLIRSVDGLEHLDAARTPEQWGHLAAEVQRFIAENGDKADKNPLAGVPTQAQLAAQGAPGIADFGSEGRKRG